MFGKLAGLDKRLGAEIDNSAAAVTAGRQNLDNIRSTILSAAAGLNENKPADRALLMGVVSKGLSQIQDTINQTTNEQRAIGGRLNTIKGEYAALRNQKFGPGEKGPSDVQKLSDDKKDGEDKPPEAKALPPEKRAAQDVKDALSGNKDAAARVDDVLNRIKPGQELTAEQSAYLNQMQNQQKDMPVARLKDIQEKLGEHGDIIPNSWQLLSNDDVPRATGKFDEQGKGGFDRLPQSVQDAIKSPGVLADTQMRDIAAIVKGGDQGLQTGTELDREMMRKADRMMDTPLFTDGSVFNDHQKVEWIDHTVQDIFDAAGRDHQIVYDQISGNHGDDGHDFLKDIATHEWADDGKAAGSLFEWTSNASGPEGKLAAETANIYADYLGTHSGDLLAIDGNRQIGDMNPDLVKAFAHGLMPYQEELVTDQPRIDTPFHRLDDLNGSLDKTKGLFAVIDSQHDAAVDWNKAAYQNALDLQQSFAEYSKEHPDMGGDDQRVDDLQASARLLGAINGGISQETLSNVHNGNMSADQALENAKSAYEFKKDIIRSVFSYAPGGDLVTNTFADQFAGPPPDPNHFKFDKTGAITDVGLTSAQQSVQYQITQAQYAVASEFIHRGDSAAMPDRFFNPDGSLKAPNQISEADWSVYDARLTASMAQYPQINNMLIKFSTTFSLVGGYHE